MSALNFEKWLRTVCFQKPTPEAYDLAKSAWQTAMDAQAERVPMTDEELEAIEVREKPLNGPKSMLNFARAIEAHHGIGAKP